MTRRLNSLAAARALFAELQTEAAERGLSLQEPPPHPTTCCGRGCEGCVWIDWYQEVARWQEQAERVLR